MIRHIQFLERRTFLSAGDLDPTFGKGGVVVDRAAHLSNLHIRDSAITPDGKILVAGDGESQYLLRRYNPDGTLDQSFGVRGSAMGSFGGLSGEEIDQMNVLPDGKIVTFMNTSITGDANTKAMLVLARFNADGSPDTSFNSKGFVTASADAFGVAYALGVQRDGAVLIGLNSNLTRYTASGALDTSFGDGGTVKNVVGGFTYVIHELANGSLLIGGTDTDDFRDAELTKLKRNGSIDKHFGNSGRMIYDVGPDKVSQATTINDLPNGDILVAATSQSDGSMLSEFRPDGTLDPAFGNGGKRLVANGPTDQFGHTFVDGNGRIYLSATDAIARFDADGNYDENFGFVDGGGADDRAIIFEGTFAGLIDGRVILAGSYQPAESDTKPKIGLIARLVADDGKTSPISVHNGVLTVVGTSGKDDIEVAASRSQSDPASFASVNGFGREFGIVDRVSVNGQAGNDLINCGGSIEVPCVVSGGDGKDSIVGDDENDTIFGNAGADTIECGAGADHIFGGGGNDILRGQGGADLIHGGPGNDFIEGDGGNDRLDGNSGNDTLHGNAGNDQFTSDDKQRDTLFGEGGFDSAIVDSLDVDQGMDSLHTST